MYTFVQTYRTEYLRSVHLLVCNFYFSKEKSYKNLLKIEWYYLLNVKYLYSELIMMWKKNHRQSFVSTYMYLCCFFLSFMMTYFCQKKQDTENDSRQTCQQGNPASLCYLCISPREWDWPPAVAFWEFKVVIVPVKRVAHLPSLLYGLYQTGGKQILSFFRWCYLS